MRLGSAQGWGPAREIHAGSGYWSQDAATQVLGRIVSVDRIQVRWPGGVQTRGVFPPEAAEILIKPDGSVQVAERPAAR
jgi:hypothetical protein